MNLCDVCVRNYGECMNDHENQPRVVYDNNEDTGDAVVDCDWYMLPRDVGLPTYQPPDKEGLAEKAEAYANRYSFDQTDPVWQDIKDDFMAGVTAILDKYVLVDKPDYEDVINVFGTACKPPLSLAIPKQFEGKKVKITITEIKE